MTVANAVDAIKVKSVIVAGNKEPEDYVAQNAEYLLKRYEGLVDEAVLNLSNPLETADVLVGALEKVKSMEALRYLIDITTFTHESLLMLVNLLSVQLKPVDTVHFVYASAAEYSPGLEGKDKWLSKGVADVRSVLGYPGETLPSQETHLIIMVGYENERAARLIEFIEPNTISLGFGDSEVATGLKHREAEEHFRDLLKSTVGLHGEEASFKFSCDDPITTKNTIDGQVARARGYNVIVAPMNNKISTVGAALAALENASIQLCYAQALQYNYKNYSNPSDRCHLFELPCLRVYSNKGT